MATRIEDQVAEIVDGQSLKRVPECTVDNPTGLDRSVWEKSPSIRAVRPGEITYASIEVTPDARARREVMKFNDSATATVVKAASAILASPPPFKIPVAIEEITNAALSLKENMDELDRNLQAIHYEKMQQYLIQSEADQNDWIEYKRSHATDGDLK